MTPVSNLHSPNLSFLFLILSYHLYKLPAQKVFTLEDFVYLPFGAPKPLTHYLFTPARIIHALGRLREYGIKCKAIHLPPNWFGSEIPDPASGMIYTVKNWIGWGEEANPYVAVPNFLGNLEKYFENFGHPDSFRLAPQFPLHTYFLPILLPYFISFELEINQKGLKKALQTQLKHFRNGVASESEQRMFSYDFTKSLTLNFLQDLSKLQAGKPQLEFRMYPPGYQKSTLGLQEFTLFFEQQAPREYQLWTQGNFSFPLLPTLFSLEDEGLISTERFIRSSQSCGQTPTEVIFPYSLSTKKQKQAIPSTQTLSHIEVLASPDNEFLVFVNQDYLNSIRFNKRQKSAALLYLLAEQGEAPYSEFSKAFDYIQTDKRFRLFAQSGIPHMRFLERGADEYIHPISQVTLRLISKSDLQ